MSANPARLARPPLVLLVDDQEWSARSLESILEPNGFAVLRAHTGRQALDMARSAAPDLVILDSHMPDLDGIELCRMLREQSGGIGAGTPIVVTTSGPSDRNQRIAAFQAGAWEFMGQPLDGEILLLKLSTFVRAKIEHDQLRAQSLLDHDTGLYSVRGLAVRAREIGAEAYRRHAALACVVIAPEPQSGGDLRGAGDAVDSPAVERIGRIVRDTGRASDAVGRLGQLEFAVIAPDTAASGAHRLAERLRESLEQIPVTVDGVPRHLTLRAGYCAVPDFAESAIEAEELILRATQALRAIGTRSGERIQEFGGG